jgi:beta-glucanase (GH16 family)
LKSLILIVVIFLTFGFSKESVLKTDCFVKRNRHSKASSISGRKDYKLIWSDEFNVDGVPDTNKWEFETGFVRNREDQWYQSENAKCKKGNLVITGKKELKPNPNYIAGCASWKTNSAFIHYTSASLKQKKKFAFKYGRVEVRAKIKTENGLWPAIWTLGVNRPWPSNGECDIMEYYKDGIHANFARESKYKQKADWNGVFKNITSFKDPDWDKKFHIWRLEWDEHSMQIYLDDLLLNSQNLESFFNLSDGLNPFRQSHYILLNLALGGDNGGSLTNTHFPTEYLIDYVRVYQESKIY